MNIDKLPKWAQQRIRLLERDLEELTKALLARDDTTTVSPFRIEHYACINGQHQIVNQFVQEGHRMVVEHEGVRLEITLPRGNQGRQGIELKWDGDKGQLKDVIFQPYSFQAARLMMPKA